MNQTPFDTHPAARTTPLAADPGTDPSPRQASDAQPGTRRVVARRLGRATPIGAVAMVAVLLTSMASPRVTQAGPLEPGHIASEARWVLHVDMEQLVQSDVGQAVFDHIRDDRELNNKVNAIADLMGLDFRKDIASLTAFGSAYGPEHVVAVVEMGRNLGKLQSLAQLAQDYQLDDSGKYPIHSWLETDGPDPGHRKYCGVWSDPAGRSHRLILADHLSSVTTLLQQMDQPRRRGRASRDLVDPKVVDDAMVYLAATRLDTVPMDDDGARVIRQFQRLTAVIKQDRRDLVATMMVVGRSSEQAEQLGRIVEGLVALGQMVSRAQPNLKPMGRLAESVSVQHRGHAVQATFRHEAGPLLDVATHMIRQHHRHDRDHDRE